MTPAFPRHEMAVPEVPEFKVWGSGFRRAKGVGSRHARIALEAASRDAVTARRKGKWFEKPHHL